MQLSSADYAGLHVQGVHMTPLHGQLRIHPMLKGLVESRGATDLDWQTILCETRIVNARGFPLVDVEAGSSRVDSSIFVPFK